jgi:DNA-binding CsgD family transcriptional regulator
MLPEKEANRLLDVISHCARCRDESDLCRVVEKLRGLGLIDLRKSSSPESLAMVKTISDHLQIHVRAATIRVLQGGTRNQKTAELLSPREKEILGWTKDGKSRWEISKILSISDETVKFHLRNIVRKLGVANRTQAVAVALAAGLIEP